MSDDQEMASGRNRCGGGPQRDASLELVGGQQQPIGVEVPLQAPARRLRHERGVEFMAPDSYRLEPEWVAVVLASLVWSGELVLAPGERLPPRYTVTPPPTKPNEQADQNKVFFLHGAVILLQNGVVTPGIKRITA